VPVTVTVPPTAEEALNVQEEVRLVALNVPGEQVVVIPDGEEDVSVTVAVNPPSGESVIVEDPVPPTVKVTDAGLAPIPKSGVPVEVADTTTVAV
jgi:hypothetical protein